MRRLLIISLLLLALSAGAEARGLLFGGSGRGGGFPPTGEPPITPPSANPITGMIFDPPYRYLDGYPSRNHQGDTYTNIWGDDGGIYVTCNDCSQPPTSSNASNNLNFMKITGFDRNDFPAALIEPVGSGPVAAAGVMHYSFGFTGMTDAPDSFEPARADWKSAGLLCIGEPGKNDPGTFYWIVRRNTAQSNYFFGQASIIKSTNHGVNWRPAPQNVATGTPTSQFEPRNRTFTAGAMFPGFIAPGGFFIYGKCNQESGPDGSDQWIYAQVHEGAGKGELLSHNDARWYLARVARNKIGDLKTSDWQYYKGPVGGDGLDNSNWAPWPIPSVGNYMWPENYRANRAALPEPAPSPQSRGASGWPSPNPNELWVTTDTDHGWTWDNAGSQWVDRGQMFPANTGATVIIDTTDLPPPWKDGYFIRGSASTKGTGCCGASQFVYLPRYHEYVVFGSGAECVPPSQPSPCANLVTAWAGPHPWGPFRVVAQFVSIRSPFNNAQMKEAWNNPIIGSIAEDGRTFTLIGSGDYLTASPSPSQGTFYTAYFRNVTVEP